MKPKKKKQLYKGEAIYAIVIAGIFMIIASISVLYVRDTHRSYRIIFPWNKREIEAG